MQPCVTLTPGVGVETVKHVLASFHELALKGAHRGKFERVLRRNIARALGGLPVADISIPARVVIRFASDVPWAPVHQRLATVFGLNALLPVTHVGRTWDELEAYCRRHAAELARGATFAVRCRRSHKLFPLTSEELQRRLGNVLRECTGMRVDLSAPDVTVRVIVQSDGVYLVHRRVPGAGGLPVGTSGRVLVLLSGGIDSPVAAYLALKRGVTAHFIHFHSQPYVGDASVRKAEEIVALLNRHQGPARLAVVPFGRCQQEIVTRCPEALRVVLYRRMMLRVAERVARRWRCQALVTGESLNQVASQTLPNLAAIDRIAHLPVLRPLISMDKQEIVDLAERIGTYELSILPHADCCSFLQPRHPTTGVSAAACAAAESALDVEGWAREVQRHAQVSYVEPTPWPSPPALPTRAWA